MKLALPALGLCAALAATAAHAAEGPVPKGMPHLNHVFVIMMENHGFGQIINNPNAPFINAYAKAANLATNFFAVAHPSLNNYLEVVGGSNFGVQSDNSPDWHNASCTPNIVAGTVNSDNPPSPAICPIAGTGTDAAIPVQDCTNETQGPPCEINIDGHLSFPATPGTVGKTIADQLFARHMSWKSYQESLPLSGADKVNVSDGVYTNLTDFSTIQPTLNPPLTQSDIVALYAAKHNPFVYFKSVQEGTAPGISMKANIAPFTGANGLYHDLAANQLPTFSFIAPNQCNDQHGRGNAGPFCNFDPNDNGTQAGLNPALIYMGDVAVQTIVNAIHNSIAWHWGNSAIVVIWDENDYSLAPNNNQIPVIVETNYSKHPFQSANFYTHFSLLKSIEGALGLPCLNHACDNNVAVMSDMFARH